MIENEMTVSVPLEVVKASEIEPKEVKWLWYPYIPFGKVTLLQGDPGDGKSKLMLSIAALLSKGEPLPFTETEENEPVTIIYQTTEDDADDTVVPRFNSAGGNGENLIFIREDEKSLEDVIIPEIFHTLYEVKSTQKSEDVDMVLLREPKDSGYYEFSANDELVITKGHNNFTPKEEAKSFHADTYCFDSKPEKECFLQYISSNKVREIYFTGMFTSNQGDLSVQYYDPESKRLRKYYPDFLALMEDGSYQLIEVKGDNKIDDEVVLAKKAAAEEMAVASGVHYLMYAGSTLMKSNVLEPTLVVQQASIDI